MRGTQINSVKDSYGTIKHENIKKALDKWGLDQVFLDMRYATKTDLDYIRSPNGLNRKCGMVIEPTWFAPNKITPESVEQLKKYGIQPRADGLSPQDEAHYASLRLADLGYGSTLCTIVFDEERHGQGIVSDSQRIIDLLSAWRSLRPTRDTIWAPEPKQGGWMSDALVAKINADANLRIARQNYFGDMTPVDADFTRLDLENRGILKGKITQVTGGQEKHGDSVTKIIGLPSDWTGIVFVLEDLSL